MSRIYSYSDGIDKFKNLITRDNGECKPFDFNECELEQIRGDYKCNSVNSNTCIPFRTSVPTCPVPISQSAIISGQIWMNEEQDLRSCLGTGCHKSLIIELVVGIGGAIIIMIVFIIY